MNEFIPFPEMRVVVANPDGKDTMLGVMSKEEALARAEDLGMDLVVVSPEAQPPVCKIINYDKLRYELEKKEKMKRKNQTVQEIKEVKLSYKIDTHDYEVRVKAATKFLTKGDKVKASIRFKGREMAHRQLAEVTMQKLANDLKAIGTPEKRPMLEGKIMLMTINPTDAVVKAAEQMRKEKLKNKAKKGAAEEEEDSSDDEDEAELAVLAVQYLSS
jgi:translation initiation factor IF-3